MRYRLPYLLLISLLTVFALSSLSLAQEGRLPLGFRKIIQGDSVCPLPSFSNRVANTRLSMRHFVAPDHGTVTLINGGSYLISGGSVVGGIYYKAGSEGNVLKRQDEVLTTSTTIWLTGDQLRMPSPVTQLDIMDITGRKVITARNSREVKLALPSGVYLIRAIFPTETLVCRLTIR